MLLSRRTVMVSAVVVFLGAASSFAGAFDYGEYWGGYWRRYDPPLGRRYDVPPTLYYGHSPLPEYGSKLPYGDPPLYTRLPRSNVNGDVVEPYQPRYYGRGRYFGPAIDPYYAPGRVNYGGYRYGWW
jgi:hypothetical protein